MITSPVFSAGGDGGSSGGGEAPPDFNLEKWLPVLVVSALATIISLFIWYRQTDNVKKKMLSMPILLFLVLTIFSSVGVAVA